MKAKSIIFIFFFIVGGVKAQNTDSIIPVREYVPDWKLNSFGISARPIQQYYLTKYTIFDAKRNGVQAMRDEYDISDSLELFRATSITNIDGPYDVNLRGVTVNVSWKKKDKANEVRVSFFMYNFSYGVTYGHGWQITPDTIAGLMVNYSENYTLGGVNLQYLKFSRMFLAEHLRVYAGTGIELATDLGVGNGISYEQTYWEKNTNDTLSSRIIYVGGVPFDKSKFSVSTGYGIATKPRIYGGINSLVGFEFLFRKLIKVHKEQFSLFAEYGLGLDGEILIGGSELARWTQQGRFGFRYFLK